MICEPEKASAIADTPQTSRGSVSAQNFNDACFFCDAKNDSELLHECQTLYLDMRVWKIAHEMLDTKLLKKLCERDMVAAEAEYHQICLVKLYNKYRDFKRRKFVDEYQDEFAQDFILFTPGGRVLGSKSDGDVPPKNFRTHPVLLLILKKHTFTNNLTQRTICRTHF